MAAGFQQFQYSIADEPDDAASRAARGVRVAADDDRDGGPGEEVGFSSDEAAARYHLSRLLEADERATMRGVTAPDRAEKVPDLKLVDVQDLPRATRLVRFEQAHAEIPIFGSRAVAELNDSRGMVAAQGSVADVQGAPTVATVSPAQALQGIARLAEVDPDTLGAPVGKLNYFFDEETQTWHLVYLFEKVPAAPPALHDDEGGHGLGKSPRSLSPLVTYLVDAADGEVVYWFSATPLAAPAAPTKCKGLDEHDQAVDFWGTVVGSEFEMRDPHFDVVTHDLQGADIEQPPPVFKNAVRAPQNDWATTNRAAVSAHANASKVSRFFKSVLARDGIDNKGMELVNVVNCTYRRHQPPPSWGNAVWYGDRMWYGQVPGPDGRLVSFSRYLDVIAHELSHGLTEKTAGLVYRKESGALNESFSDIFGVMVKNWDFEKKQGGDVEGWNWEIGSGLGGNGLPLRDLSDPTRTEDPAHYDDRYTGARDNGGVHINSNIHNKAAYNLLTAKDEQGERQFTPEDVAILYYYTLLALSSTAVFKDVLSTILQQTSTMYAGDPTGRAAKTQAVRDAYEAVGVIVQ